MSQFQGYGIVHAHFPTSLTVNNVIIYNLFHSRLSNTGVVVIVLVLGPWYGTCYLSNLNGISVTFRYSVSFTFKVFRLVASIFFTNHKKFSVDNAQRPWCKNTLSSVLTALSVENS